MNHASHLSRGLLLLPLLAGIAAANGECFDFDWRFARGEMPGAEAPSWDDAKWDAVDLPHDFCIHGPFDPAVQDGKSNGFRPLGVGWYRKAFVTPEDAGRAVYRLDFEGVFERPQVWVNGALAASGSGGWHGFEVELSPHLRPPGETNVVAVRADASKPPGVTWYNGGGIYRHVWLRTSGAFRFARHEPWVTTPLVAADQANLRIRAEVDSRAAAGAGVAVIHELYTPDGRPAGQVRSAEWADAGATAVFQHEIVVQRPRRWSPDDPALYRLVSRVEAAGRVSDRRETMVGFRDIRITPEGLFLNGARLFVKGVNLHDDYGCLGAAAFDRAIERRLGTLKEIGINAVRLAHNPHAPALLDLCDRLGLLVYDEAFCNWGDFENGAFAGTWRGQLEEFVRRDRNHPSVFVWSVGNQVSAAERAPDYGRAGYDAMAAVVRKTDPTRPVTLALRPYDRGARDIHPLALRADVMSANYMEKWFARDRLAHTNLSFITSECSTGDRGRGPWRDLDRAHAVGLFYWGGVDYIGESHGWPQKGWKGGFVDWAGFRKPSSWVLESLISERPVVRLFVQQPGLTYTNWDGIVVAAGGEASHWRRPATGTQSVEVVSNAEEVEVLLNGRSLGSRRCRRDESLYWRIPWEAGTLAAIARSGGAEVARHELQTAGEAKALRLSPDRTTLRADGQDLAHILVEVVDERGITVPDAHPRIAFHVTGAGILAGVQNGNPDSDEPFQADRHHAFAGRALLVVRGGRKPGRITVNASAGELAPAELTIPVEGERKEP